MFQSQCSIRPRREKQARHSQRVKSGVPSEVLRDNNAKTYGCLASSVCSTGHDTRVNTEVHWEGKPSDGSLYYSNDHAFLPLTVVDL